MGLHVQTEIINSGNILASATVSGLNLIASSLSAGGIVFPTSAGQLTQSTSQLYWNSSTNRLGVGIGSTPGGKLHVDTDPGESNIAFLITHEDSGNRAMVHGINVGSGYDLRLENSYAGGTSGIGTKVYSFATYDPSGASSGLLSTVSFAGWTLNGSVSGNPQTYASVQAWAIDNSSGSPDGGLFFRTKVNGTDTLMMTVKDTVESRDHNPMSDLTYNLGTSTKRWNVGYFNTAVVADLSGVSTINGSSVLFGSVTDKHILFGSGTQIYNKSNLVYDYSTGRMAITGISGQSADFFQISDFSSNELFSVGASDLIINEGGQDRDFRIEGDTDASLFRLDAGLDVVSIGGSPSSPSKLIVYCNEPVTSVNSTQFYNASYMYLGGTNIASGVIDSGYRRGIYIQSYPNTSSFVGTLANMTAIHIDNGAFGTNSSGTVSTSYGLRIVSYAQGSGSVGNLWGLYVQDIDGVSKNYIQRDLRVGTTANTGGFLANFAGDVGPAANLTHSLGSNSFQWLSVYAGSGSFPALVNVTGINGIAPSSFLNTFNGSIGLNQIAYGAGTNIFGGNANFLYTSGIRQLMMSGTTSTSIPNIALYGSGDMLLFNMAANQDSGSYIRWTEGTTYAGAYLNYEALSNVFYIGVHSTADSLKSSDVNAISINRSTGYVGVGRVPQSALHVFESTSNTDLFAGLTVEQSGTGDALVQFLLTGAQRWVVGVDNSDNDRFKISWDADLADNTPFVITTSGTISLGGGTSTPSAYVHIMPTGTTTLANGDLPALRIQRAGTSNRLDFYNDATANWIVADDPGSNHKHLINLIVCSGSDLTKNFYLYFADAATKTVSQTERMTMRGSGVGGINLASAVPGAAWEVVSPQLAIPTILARGIAAQTASLIEARNSSANDLFHVRLSEVVINDGSIDLDTRIETNNDANMLFVDGGNDWAVFGDSSNPGSFKLAVGGFFGPTAHMTYDIGSLAYRFKTIYSSGLDLSGQLKLADQNGVLKAYDGVVMGGATTSDMPEGANLYFTDLRAITAVGTSGTFTPGSIIYAGTLGGLDEDAGEFHYDATNRLMGIRTNQPTAHLHVKHTSARIRLENNGSATAALSGVMYSGSPGLHLSAGAQNNSTNPYSPGIIFESTDPQLTTLNPKGLAGIVGRATETYSADNTGGMALDFITSPNTPGTTGAYRVVMTIDQNGYLGVGSGTTTPSTPLHVFENSTNTNIAGATIEQGGTGDSVLNFLLTGGQQWVVGIDNSDSDKFKISDTVNVGSNPILTITNTELIGINNSNPSSSLQISNAAGATTVKTFRIDGIASQTADFVGVFDDSANELFSIGGSTADFVVNEAGLVRDFRVESDTHSNALMVNGTYGTVGINISAGGAGQILRSFSDYPDCTTNGTNFYRNINHFATTCNIASGVIDSGYRVGEWDDFYITSSGFVGELIQQYGKVILAGTFTTAPSGTIDTIYNLFLGINKGANCTHGIEWGIYQTDSSSASHNYFAGDMRIGTTGNAGSFKINSAGSVGPQSDSTYSLGSDTLRWLSIYSDSGLIPALLGVTGINSTGISSFLNVLTAGAIQANQVMFGSGANTFGGNDNFTWTNSIGRLMISGNNVATIPRISLYGSGQMIMLNSSSNHPSGNYIRWTEGSNYQGAYINYDSSGNKLLFGVHETADSSLSSDVDVITLDRLTGRMGINQSTPTSTLELVTRTSATTGILIAGTTSQSADLLHVRDVSSNELFSVGASDTVFNEAGLARDFRVESDTYSNFFSLDGTNDHLTIGQTTSSTSWEIAGKDNVLTIVGGFSSSDVYRLRAPSVSTSLQYGQRDSQYITPAYPGRLLNRNPDFMMQTVGDSGTTLISFARYGATFNTIAILQDNTAPNKSAKIMRCIYPGSGSGSTGIGGFYCGENPLSAATDDIAVNAWSKYRKGSRFATIIWANLEVGRNIKNGSNAIGTSGNQNWITSQAGTGKWEKYVLITTIGESGTFSTTNFFYADGDTSSPASWDVASCHTIALDEDAATVDFGQLNVGLKESMNIGWGELVTTSTSYLATDGGSLRVGTTGNPGSFLANFAGSVGPNADATYALGSNTFKWLSVNASSGNIPALVNISGINNIPIANYLSGGGATISGSITAGQVGYGSASNVLASNSNFLYNATIQQLTLSGTTAVSIPNIALYGSGDMLLFNMTANQGSGSYVRWTESTTYQGGYINYDAVNNRLNIGVHETADSLVSSDTDAITIARSSAFVGMGVAPTSKLHTYESNSNVGTSAGLTIEQAGAGDSVVQFLLTGAQRWVVGADNSDSDKFKISRDTDLNDNSFLVITTDDRMTLGGSTSTPSACVLIQPTGATTPGGTGILRLQRGAAGGNFIEFFADSNANYVVSDDTGSNQKSFSELIISSGSDLNLSYSVQFASSANKGTVGNYVNRFQVRGSGGIGVNLAGAAPDAAIQVTNFSAEKHTLHLKGISAQTGDHIFVENSSSQELFSVGSTDFIVNEAGLDRDTRIETLNDANFFVIDAGTNAIGIGGAGVSANYLMLVQGATSNPAGHFAVRDTSSNELFSVGASDLIVNEAGLDRDFRIESDTNANMFIVDAGTDCVLIGTASNAGSFKLNVNGSIGPQTSGTYDLGSAALPFRHLYVTSGTIFIGDNMSLYSPTDRDAEIMMSGGRSAFYYSHTSDAVGIGTRTPTSFRLEISGAVGPTATTTFDFGSSSRVWRKGYFATGDIPALLSVTGINGTGIASFLSSGGTIGGSITDSQVGYGNGTNAIAGNSNFRYISAINQLMISGGTGTAGVIPNLVVGGSGNMFVLTTPADNASGAYMRITEATTFIGGYMSYDAVNNRFQLGTHQTSDSLTSSDLPAITIARNTANVGIGGNALSPAYQLSLGSSANNTKLAFYDDGVAGNTYGMGIGTNQFRFHIGGTAASRFSFLNGAAGTEVFTISGTGLVGINQATPTAALHIVPTGATCTGVLVVGASSQSAPYVKVTTNGNSEIFSIDNNNFTNISGHPIGAFCQMRSSGVTDCNQASRTLMTGWVTAPEVNTNTNVFSFVTSGVKVLQAGKYKMSLSIYATGTSTQDVAVGFRVNLMTPASTAQSGICVLHLSANNPNGFNETSCSFSKIVTCNANDVIGITYERLAGTGTTAIPSGDSFLIVERMLG